MLLKSLFKKREITPPEPAAFVCEVIQTYDGFSIRKVGTECWAVEGYSSYTVGKYYWYWNEKQRYRKTFKTLEEAIERARKLEDEDHLRILQEKAALMKQRERAAFVEKKVWR